MLGAILGDIIGSPYEATRNNIKTTDFPLFSERSHFTDDTVMTIAVAEGLMHSGNDEEGAQAEIIAAMRKYGKMYPGAGYGVNFREWIFSREPEPYGSYGNGSAMRVSSVAWLFDDLETVERFARISAAVTHNHPEGIKGAQATAAAIFMARTGETLAAIKRCIEERYGYNLSRTPDMIRPGYVYNPTCQQTVPEAITAFLHSNGFENAIRIAVSLGGDSDTLAAITGSIAEAAYGVPEELKEQALSRLKEPLLAVYRRFAEKGHGKIVMAHGSHAPLCNRDVMPTGGSKKIIKEVRIQKHCIHYADVWPRFMVITYCGKGGENDSFWPETFTKLPIEQQCSKCQKGLTKA